MSTTIETSYGKGLEGYGTVSDSTPAGNGISNTTAGASKSASSASAPIASHPATMDGGDVEQAATVSAGLRMLEARSVHWYSYLQTWDFWVVVLLGQVLSLCITATNTFSNFLATEGTSIPAFQSFFNYVLLALVYVPILLYRRGWRYVLRSTLFSQDGWKFVVLSFLDAEGNYFTVLAYRYTDILSAQLLNFWSIVCVVVLSFSLLRVRYRPFQIAGILVACGGMGLLLASDHITGSSSGPAADRLKGDLFGLLGASLYGLSNVTEEWFVSRRPAYEVLACLGVFGIIVNGVTAAIFDRASFASATWNGKVGGHLTGYTLALFIFYSLAPFILRMGSAAFFDISLLTANFWGVIIGIHVFGYTIHFLYPIAFVLIVFGFFIYFLSGSLLGDAKKPWLGDNQEEGVAGYGTAKLKALNEARKQGLEQQQQSVAEAEAEAEAAATAASAAK